MRMRGKRSRPIQNNSSVDWTLRTLRANGRPMRTDDILRAIVAQGGPMIQKSTLVSNLSRYVKHHDTFDRPAPDTYGLVEWDRSADELFGNPEDDPRYT